MSRLVPLNAIRRLDEIIGLEGNTDNYYDAKNSSLDHVLKTRKGIPLTLVVIYKLILHDVGVHVDVIGLPGHVVLGLEGGETFVDVYNASRVLSLGDCREISGSYGVDWTEEFTRPLPPRDVLVRMSANIVNCCQRQYDGAQEANEGTPERALSLITARSLVSQKAVQCVYLSSGYLADYCRRNLWNLFPFLHPEIFVRFNLIDEDSAKDYVEEGIRVFLYE